MLSKQTSYKYALAKVQQLQDMYSRYFQVSISIYNMDNQHVTIPSNQIPFCNKKLSDSDSICYTFSKQMIERRPETLIVSTCPYQCFFAIAPLGLPLDTYDAEDTNYYIVIKQNHHKNTKDLFAAFNDIENVPDDPHSTKFYEISNLIVSSFDIIFSLMTSEELITIQNNKKQKDINKEDLNKLTTREREIAHFVSIGMSNQQIANQLQISEHTVKAHISNILKKLNLNNRTQMAIYEMQS